MRPGGEGGLIPLQLLLRAGGAGTRARGAGTAARGRVCMERERLLPRDGAGASGCGDAGPRVWAVVARVRPRDHPSGHTCKLCPL